MSSGPLLLPALQPAYPLKVAGIAALVALMLIPVAIAVHAGVYDSSVDNPLMGWGMWGTFAIYASLRPRRRELVATISIGLVFRLAYNLAVGERGYWGSAVIGMGVFLGLASVVMLAGLSLGAPSELRAARRRALVVIGLLSYMGVFLNFYISFAKIVLPGKLDYFLYSFDGSLGLQASFAIGRLVHELAPLQRTIDLVYDSLGFWFALIVAAHINPKRKYRFSIVKLLVANAGIGFSLYFLFPAMGPRYAFHAFPQLPAGVQAAPALLSGVPNAMPSLHFATALLICWLSTPWKWLSRITVVFCALTAIATLGTGEHYLVDLVVAFPYALAIFALCAGIPERTRPLLAGAGMVFGWMAFLRFGHYYFAASWILVLVTIVASLALKRSLAARVWVS